MHRREFHYHQFYPNLTLGNGIPGYQHEWPELAVVMDGSLNVLIEDVVYEARVGDWLVFRPTVFHNESRPPDITPCLFERFWRFVLVREIVVAAYDLDATVEYGEDLETKLVNRVAPFYANHAKEGRQLIVGALKSPGSIRLQPGQIRVQLGRQSAPCRTRAIGKLCEELNPLKPIYPGTNLQIVFDAPAE